MLEVTSAIAQRRAAEQAYRKTVELETMNNKRDHHDEDGAGTFRVIAVLALSSAAVYALIFAAVMVYKYC